MSFWSRFFMFLTDNLIWIGSIGITAPKSKSWKIAKDLFAFVNNVVGMLLSYYKYKRRANTIKKIDLEL